MPSLQIEPQQNFLIARNLQDVNDTGTYYVRAFIYEYNPVDGSNTELDTVDLIDQGTQRFNKVWLAPADDSGQGKYILIFSRVYTDSGYTTESEKYYREENEYLIKQTYNPILGGGGGSWLTKGSMTDLVRKELKRILKKMPQPIIPKEVDFTELLEAIENKPVTPETNLGGLARIVEKTNMALADRPKFEKTDLSKVESSIKEATSEIKKAKLDKTVEATEKMLERIRQFFTKDLDEIKKIMSELKKEFKKRAFVAVDKDKVLAVTNDKIGSEKEEKKETENRYKGL